MNIEKLRADITRDEGVRLELYHCPAGKLTIGIGRNLEDRGISIDEALMLLDNDIEVVTKELIKAGVLGMLRGHPESVERALLNMAFNMGVPRLLGFKKMLAALEARDYALAAKEALDSNWARQVGARAERIAALIRIAED